MRNRSAFDAEFHAIVLEFELGELLLANEFDESLDLVQGHRDIQSPITKFNANRQCA